MCLLSIVIPNYNNGQFLLRCLESILCSKRMNFEVIVIDDGSSDNSIEVLKLIKDKRLCYYTQENQGVSAARNAGIKKAKGEFITFCDADDYYVDDAITELILYLEDNKSKYELFIFDIYKESMDIFARPHREKWEIALSEQMCTREKEEQKIPKKVYVGMICKNSNMNSVFNKVYKTSMLEKENILFPNEIGMGEDGIFNLKYASYCSEILYISKTLYIYCTEENKMNSGNRKSQLSTLNEIVKGLNTRNEIIAEYVLINNMPENKKRNLYALLSDYAVEQIYGWGKRIRKIEGKVAYKEYLDKNPKLKRCFRGYFLKKLSIKRKIQAIWIYKQTL